MLLTHFGMFDDVGVIADQLVRWLEFSSGLVAEGKKSGDALGTLEQRFKWNLEQEVDLAASRSDLALTAEDRKLIRFDLELNAQGLAIAATRPEKS